MTSEEIKAAVIRQEWGQEALWLKEIAYQLAVRNERNTPQSFAEACAQADAVTTVIRDRQQNTPEGGDGCRFHSSPEPPSACAHSPLGPECGPCRRRRTFA